MCVNYCWQVHFYVGLLPVADLCDAGSFWLVICMLYTSVVLGRMRRR